MIVSLEHYLCLSAVLFTLGVFGIFLNLVSFSSYLNDIQGQIFTIFVLTVAAAEAAIGLAILVIYYRNSGSISVEEINKLRG